MLPEAPSLRILNILAVVDAPDTVLLMNAATLREEERSGKPHLAALHKQRQSLEPIKTLPQDRAVSFAIPGSGNVAPVLHFRTISARRLSCK
jgi:hypothetical protein